MRRVATTALVLLLSALAACGSGDTVAAEDAYKVLLASPDATSDAGPAKVSYTIEVGTGQVIEAEGVIDASTESASIEMEIPGGGTLNMITQGHTMYLEIPSEARAELGVSTPWASIDIQRTGEAATGLAGGGLTNSATNDPADALAALRGVAKDGVRTIGREEIRGTDTTRYEADVDLQRALATQEIADREAFEQFAERLGGGTSRYNVWLDDDGVVRKMSFRMPVAGTMLRMTMEFYDFGRATVPELPPPGDVTDITDQVLAQVGTAN
jgi:hypothetical protein